MRLKDRIAVVTGAAAGIGRAIAREFAKEGARLAVCDIREDRLAEAAAELRGLGADVHAIRADVGRYTDVRALFEGVQERLGGLDILVNNAAVIHQASVVDTKEEDWDRIIRNNLTSVFLCCREGARLMIAQGRGGRIINLPPSTPCSPSRRRERTPPRKAAWRRSAARSPRNWPRTGST